MKVVVAKTELAKLRRRMLRAYPRERLEMIWGRRVGFDEFHIHMFDTITHTATNMTCEYDTLDVEASKAEAKEHGLEWLGSIHSHPDWEEVSPSEHDHDEGVKLGEIISGIIAIWVVDKEVGRLRSRIKWWGPIVGVETTYID